MTKTTLYSVSLNCI